MLKAEQIRLEDLRLELYKLVKDKGSFVDPTVVEKSEFIDDLIVELQLRKKGVNTKRYQGK